ncbi:hypothetical protein D3C85_652860 [compost metagenome]
MRELARLAELRSQQRVELRREPAKMVVLQYPAIVLEGVPPLLGSRGLGILPVQPECQHQAVESVEPGWKMQAPWLGRETLEPLEVAFQDGVGGTVARLDAPRQHLLERGAMGGLVVADQGQAVHRIEDGRQVDLAFAGLLAQLAHPVLDKFQGACGIAFQQAGEDVAELVVTMPAQVFQAVPVAAPERLEDNLEVQLAFLLRRYGSSVLQTQFVGRATRQQVLVAQVQIVLEQQRPQRFVETEEQLQSLRIARHLVHGVNGVEALKRHIAIQRLE